MEVFMKKKFDAGFVRSVILTMTFVVGVLVVVSPFSCKLTEEGIDIIPADTQAPCVKSFSAFSSTSIFIECSEKIVLGEISVVEVDDENSESDFLSIDDKNVFAVANSVTYSENGKSAEICLSEPTFVGKTYIFSGVVYDVAGNSLEFCQEFSGFNENPARLIFNEVRTSYDRKSKETQFVEFYVLKSGNLSGLEYFSTANGSYKFPAVDVKQGDYIVLHGFTVMPATKTYPEITIEGCADELGDDLTLSKTADSCATARDLWKLGGDKLASNSDVLVLRDSTTKNIYDALLLSSSGTGDWSSKNKWPQGADQTGAVYAKDASTIKRTISRQNTKDLSKQYSDSATLPDFIETKSSEWIVTNYSANTLKGITLTGATPGTENSKIRYVKSKK